MPAGSTTRSDHEAVVERPAFGSAAAVTVRTPIAGKFEAGVPPMPARVFAALLVTDSGRLTAAELTELLGASPAAISGAVRYLEQVGMISRQREPGSRRDVYLLRNDLWYEISLGRDQVLAHWANAARDGAEILGPDTPAGQRLADSHDFFVFLRQELPALLERWRAHKAQG